MEYGDFKYVQSSDSNWFLLENAERYLARTSSE